MALRLCRLFELRGLDALVCVLRQQPAQEVFERLVAHLPPQHVEDHRALFQRHRLELRRERIQPPQRRQRLRVIRQRTRRNIRNRCLERVFSRRILQVHQLAVPRHAIGDPGIV